MALRSLLVEIYPPQLDGVGLGAALQDLVAPVGQAGVEVQLTVDGSDQLSDEATALIWRTAQECVRNAQRHAFAETLEVTVTTTGDPPVAVLTVTDDGSGFDPSAATAADSFGLRGLRELAAEAGGMLSVESSPGAGTSVTLEVPAR
jgi:signal transduction histidine kinase